MTPQNAISKLPKRSSPLKPIDRYEPIHLGILVALSSESYERRSDVFHVINRGLMLVAKLCLITVVLAVGYTVVMRFLFDDSPSWTFDLASLMMLPLTYLAAAAIATAKGHVTVDVVVEMAGPRIGRVLEALGEAIAAVFVVYLAYLVSSEFFDIFASGRVTGSARLPYWPAALCVPIGLIALAVEFARQAIVSARQAANREEAAS